jgi:2-hydroxychromene-2-carboxylate isomerase
MLLVYHDYPSAASAVAVLRLQRLADEGGAVAFAGIDTLGLDATVPATLDVLADHERWTAAAAELGMPLRRPTLHPATTRAHAIGEVAEELGMGASWRLTCYRAFWQEGIDLNDPDRLVELALGAGLDPDPVTDLLADATALAAARRRMHIHRGRGIGGVPVLSVDGALVPASLPDADLRTLAGLT